MEQHANPSVDTENTNASMDGNMTRVDLWITKDGKIRQELLDNDGALIVWNATQKFRDGFVLWVDPNVWEIMENTGLSNYDIGWNSAGSSYLRLSMSPFWESKFEILSKQVFNFPSRFIFGFSQSQRILGQELEISLVGVDSSGVIENNTARADLSISGTVTVTTNVATINFATAHGLKWGDRIICKNNADTRLNTGPVVATIITATQITIPLTLANGTYTSGWVIARADPFDYAKNGVGLLTENLTVTNGSIISRRNGASYRTLNTTISSVTATQSNVSPYTDAFNSANSNELIATMQEMIFNSKAPDALTAVVGTAKFTQGIPDEEKQYKLRVRAYNLPVMTAIKTAITSISKSGTTTATVTTRDAHGLTTSSFVQLSGVRDITNFPNLAMTQVASVIDATHFTIVIGSAVTATSAGGAVALVHGSIAMIGLTWLSIASISRTAGITTITMNTTASWALPGEYWTLYGLESNTQYEGIYKILRMTGSTYEAEFVSSINIADFWSITTGGVFVKRTDHRIHSIQEMEYTRHVMELANQNGTVDLAKALAVVVANVPAFTLSSGTVTTVSSVTAVASVTSDQIAIPGIIADVASAALTTTTTTATITPTFGDSYSVNIPVTAVTGTTPTMDVDIQESDDTGTNWFTVYSFPRITANGIYRSPVLKFTGNRIRYVQTVAGTTPSFTRAINRLQCSDPVNMLRQLIDRTVALITLNATTGTLEVKNCTNIKLALTLTTATTVPVLQLEGSEDNGATWVSIGATLTGVASSTVQITTNNTSWGLIRARVSTAGVTLGTGYSVTLKWF